MPGTINKNLRTGTESLLRPLPSSAHSTPARARPGAPGLSGAQIGLWHPPGSESKCSESPRRTPVLPTASACQSGERPLHAGNGVPNSFLAGPQGSLWTEPLALLPWGWVQSHWGLGTPPQPAPGLAGPPLGSRHSQPKAASTRAKQERSQRKAMLLLSGQEDMGQPRWGPCF